MFRRTPTKLFFIFLSPSLILSLLFFPLGRSLTLWHYATNVSSITPQLRCMSFVSRSWSQPQPGCGLVIRCCSIYWNPSGNQAPLLLKHSRLRRKVKCVHTLHTFWHSILLLHFNLLEPTGHVMHHQFLRSTTVRSAHTVFMCFVFIWEQTATCATCSINWLVFITEMKSAYSAVRTGSLNKAVCS